MAGVTSLIEQRPGGSFARIVIDNPTKLNTLNSALMARLADALAALSARDDVRAVVLAGEGPRAFIGGADIGEMAGLDPVTGRAFITRLHRVCDALRRLPVPVIARIQGYAFGGGLEIAAACDLRIASQNATFGMPEVKLGIPSVIEAALLPMLVGWGRARQILFLGETFSAAEAEKWGFVQWVVPADALDDTVERCLDAIMRCGKQAIRLQKSLIQAWEGLTPRAAIEAGIGAFASAWETEEPRLAMKEFLAARAARKHG